MLQGSLNKFFYRTFLIIHSITLLPAAETAAQRYDIIWDVSIHLSLDDTDGLPPKEYYLVWADHADNIMGSCLYIVHGRPSLTSPTCFFLSRCLFLSSECLLCEFTMEVERDFFVITYRSYSYSNLTLYKKWCFPLRIWQIYWRNP